MTCSFLPRELIASCGLGCVMWGKIALPLLHVAQLFSHSIFEFDLIICLHVFRDTGKLGCSWVAPFFASISAVSFPGRSQWLGIHCRVIFKEKSSMNLDKASLRFLMALVVCLSVSRACRTDFESVKITMFAFGVFFYFESLIDLV